MQSTLPPPKRQITRLLVANRGEITSRILQAAHELSPQIETYTLHTQPDTSHLYQTRPTHSILLPSASSYTDITYLISLIKEHNIDAVHPGYGFLSESTEFARRLAHETSGETILIGPGAEILKRVGGKTEARALARGCEVPVLEALEAVGGEGMDVDVEICADFAAQVGYPVMIKAVDGGGGRGVRVVQGPDDLKLALERTRAESSSHKIFVEKAALRGFRHIEVQVIGDGTGDVRHLWERECSIQRRWQKVVEVAPAMVRGKVVQKVTAAALRMAREVEYLSLGTFEFLVNEKTGEFYFLEVNPRLQVEHTVTESLASIDLVEIQLLLAQGYSLEQVGLGTVRSPEDVPSIHSIQLRLCAEDPSNHFGLSTGKIQEVHMPTGNGVRVDTHLTNLSPVTVGSDFDNLLAKIIVTSTSWDQTIRKARRALEDVRIVGVKTNLDLLRGILESQDFQSGNFDTQWLERNLDHLLRAGEALSRSIESTRFPLPSENSSGPVPTSTTTNVLFRKGDAWSIDLAPLNTDQRGSSGQEQLSRHLLVNRVLRNDFPTSLTAEIDYTSLAGAGSPASTVPYKLTLTSTNTSASALNSDHRRGDPRNPSHICLPISGKLIEMLVAEGDEVVQEQVIAFVKQMKMELEVRSHRAGRVTWALQLDSEDGEDVAEGILLAELGDGAKAVEFKGKL